MIELFIVTTRATEYHGCKDVLFTWFYNSKRAARRPYEELIEDYDPGSDCACCAEGHIDELFSASEAHSLKDYLDRVYGDCGTTSIEKVALPIEANSMVVSAIPVGGGDDFLMLDGNPHYSLPFSVQGYFSLVGCELADGSGETFRHYLFRFGGGEARFETQEEARQREHLQDVR